MITQHLLTSGPSYPLFHAMKRKQEPETSPSHPKKTKPSFGSASDTVPSLQELLDFNQIGNSEEDINHRFNHIAKTLFHEFHLVVVVKHTTTTQEYSLSIRSRILSSNSWMPRRLVYTW